MIPTMNLTRSYHTLIAVLLLPAYLCAQDKAALHNRHLDVEWRQGQSGYRIVKAAVVAGNGHTPLAQPSGEYTVLYSARKPDSRPLRQQVAKRAATFPEPIYRYLIKRWDENLEPVAMNTAGKALHFFPATATQDGDTAVVFRYGNDTLQLTARWSLEARYPQDITVTLTLKALKPGYYALATPALATVPEQQLAWGMIPGYFQAKSLQHDLVSSYGYGQGIPDRPIILRERTASTLCPLIQDRNGISLAVIPAPGTGRDPWESDHNTHSEWKLGLSLMDRKGALTPVAYHPVLGQQDSYMQPGEERAFAFRYSLQAADWYSVYKHAIYDIYRFRDFLALKQTRQSLTDRIMEMLHYVKADSTSRWRMAVHKGLQIGAQDYLGGVVGSDKDATKNSDYGAMWMLARLTGDTLLERQRLPYALNFKLMQQQEEPGFFQGATTGQYYLWKSKRFTEEWGAYVEPVALTYYTMMDMGNILLFEPGNQTLRKRLRLGADKLLQWQHADGRWEVAYDHNTTRPMFTDLQDLRPTFYGLLVAYRILGDKKYLAAARRGADWFVKEATDRGYFLGVCGDARFVADFATGQSVQALLELYDLTGEQRYRDAAIATARIYTASIYTHPIPSRRKKTVNGVTREDWEISQAGLSFEHGGSLGSATVNGPILLASHAGMFVRLFSMTGDSLYLDMARAAALGRDAFVHQPTGVASYYWNVMDKGAGPYPHHAWWQVGWITDYLLSEAALRSGGKINFPPGFITPKVGPHLCYGFAPGKVFGRSASLYLPDSMLQVSNPLVDYMSAIDTASSQLYVMLLNNDDETQQANVQLDLEKVLPDKKVQLTIVRLLDHKGQRDGDVRIGASQQVTIPPYGLKVLLFSYAPADTQYVAVKHWVCVNQWGYNSNAPKRFTVPTAAQENLHFRITRQNGTEKLFEGMVQNGIGDFTEFRPADPGPYTVQVESSRLPGAASYPFEIGPFVLERMAAQPSIDFMNDCRSITGTHPSAYGGCPWRDGTFYSYEIPSLVLMYLSNPQQYERLPATIDYAAMKRKVLDPAFRLVKAPNDSTALASARRYFTEIPPLTGKHIPDLMWDLHWGIGYYLVNPLTADPSDNSKPPPELHAQTLAQFAYFLYAYPWLEKWFPQSIYEQALQFALAHWKAAGLLEVRREIGSPKGRYAPGFSILPNLMMYEVCRREQQSHPEAFMQAARRQAEWIIDSLDLQDPLVTKGQRMSEHMLMTGLAFYQLHYPDAAPAGLQQKINEWVDVVISRSGNMWDFRRYDLDSNWTVPWYNEVGNVAGFPASALQAAAVITDTAKRYRLLEIAFAHFDNLYGRNPLNVFTAHYPEMGFTGVEKGFPKGYHEDVCARLELVRGALSCLPGTEMYPFNPAGSYRHLEGWVNHNTAWNVSLAMLNWFDNQPLSLTRQENGLAVRWQAPVNDDVQARESLPLIVYVNGREAGTVTLAEEGSNSHAFAALLPLKGNKLVMDDRQVRLRKGDVIRLAYGRGILEKGMELRW
ncbi:hypothetical protein LX66_5346 [Chitinophaga japonensis]|uniref:Glycerophosphoryl diester phosphodiesterase n=2 Tax=Chitinophaga japonensis TaxID=104662 RepID=A0A562SL48_CHIJA|nr:hypothetical protein LX66_5346 [Chitinophaga japonensis]